MPEADHHSAYLTEAIAGLTTEGRDRVEELLDQLVESAGTHASVVEFAEARKAELNTGRIEPSDPGPQLATGELDELTVGFMRIRDDEPLDDVSNWANAVLALLKDEPASGRG